MTDVVSSTQNVVVAVRQQVLTPGVAPPKVGLVEIHGAGSGGGGGGGSKITIGDTPPANPVHGDQFWESDTGGLFVFYDDGNSQQWVQIAPGSSSAIFSLDSADGLTVDTGEKYRIIMLSNGSTFAIPYAAVPPTAPTGVVAIARLTSVNLNWGIVSGATSFVIKRNGIQIGTTGNQTYRDTNIVIGNTYSYTVSSVDQYKQRSPPSATVSAFIDPSLNAAPTNVAIYCWPNPIPTDGPAYIRVNAREIDVQNIAYMLGVDAGSLSATADPSVWAFRI